MTQSTTLVGRRMVDEDGNKIGKIVDIFTDARTMEPKWVAVNLGVLHPHHPLVPLRDAFVADSGQLVVPFKPETVKQAPFSHGVSPNLSEEAELTEHYGLDPEQGRLGATDR